MKRIIFLLTLFFFTLTAHAQFYKRAIQFIDIETEREVNNDMNCSTTKDTILYQATFDLENDSIYMSMGERILRINMLHQSSKHYVLQFFDRERLTNSFNITLNKNNIQVNKDIYVINSDDLQRYGFDIMTALNLLKDNLGDYPRDELEILRLNWDIPYHSYKIKSVTSYIKDPFGDKISTLHAMFLYNKNGCLVKISQPDRYELSNIIYKTNLMESYHVYYNQNDKMQEDYVYHQISNKKEERKGTWIHAASGTEYNFTRTYTRLE
ncbi:hypothetical protein [Prevotella denticola]|uniref:hypothetical protein n=1 Tax=Prevotella denticola TaxID=28129 RepID=UPI001CB26221|nr:hypothetical protein [Prevotella denticola]MBF1387402.1 hypothetical protein [Prevotella denticola]